MTWNGKLVSYQEKGDRIWSMPPEDRELPGARDPSLPATLLVRLQGHCKLLAGKIETVVLCPSWGVHSRESYKCQGLSPGTLDPELKIIQNPPCWWPGERLWHL